MASAFSPSLGGQPVHWLLLRGLGRERAHWFDFPERLRAQSGADAVTCLDLAGAGTERHRRAPLSIVDYASDVYARVSRTRTEGARVWIFGISLGGMVALALARRFGDDLAGIAIANSSAADCPLMQRLQPRAVAMLLSALATQDIERRERAVFALTSNREDAEQARAVATAVDAFRARPISRWTVLAQLWAASRFHLPERLPVPLLVLRSLGDRLVDPDCSRAIADHFGAPCHAHPSAGHDLPFDAPDWLAAELTAFQRHQAHAGNGAARRPAW